MTDDRVVLVTGGARRIGAEIVKVLHGAGMNIALHYRGSTQEAQALEQDLNRQRDGSARSFQADLVDCEAPEHLITECVEHFGRLDALVNNASAFYPTPLGSVTENQWEELFATNLKAPFFLSQAAAPALVVHDGCIVNITDVHADQPMLNHAVYSMAKAGLVMMTRSLAKELGPAIRVNGVAPGAILWPEAHMPENVKTAIVRRTGLKRQGTPEEIAGAVLFLIRDATYTTGEVIRVDGGRHLYM